MTNNLLEVHKKIMSAGYAERLSEYPNKVSTLGDELGHILGELVC